MMKGMSSSGKTSLRGPNTPETIAHKAFVTPIQFYVIRTITFPSVLASPIDASRLLIRRREGISRLWTLTGSAVAFNGELAFTLPLAYFIRHGWHKWIVRKAFEDLLPHQVVWRKHKMGFPIPLQRLFSTSPPTIQTLFQQLDNPYVDLPSFERFASHRARMRGGGMGRVYRPVAYD
jgi:hypothetical protein